MVVSARWAKPKAIVLVLALLLGSLAFTQAPTQAQEGEEFTLTVLHNNDGESKLLPDEDAGFPGVARFVTHMKELQEAAGETGGVVTLTSGDNFLASQEIEVARKQEGPLYDSIALSGIYDAMGLGNHDFDLGPEFAARFISGFDPAVPFLSANMDFSDEPELAALVDEGLIGGHTTVETDGEMIGIIGAVTPQLPNISTPRNATVSAVLGAVSSAARELESDGVNKIILISHLQDVNEELELVGELSNVDIVIAGGGDDLLANEGDTCMPDEEPTNPYPVMVEDSTGTEVAVITAPGGYRCIGELTATFDSDGTLTNASGRSIGVGFDVTPDSTIQSEVVDPLSEAVSEIDQDIIGSSEVDLDGRRGSVRTFSSNQGSLLADALRFRATALADDFGTPVPHAALQNGGGIRNDAIIPAGDISTGDTWDIAPFSNFLVVGEIPRSVFHRMLEQSVDRIPGAGGQFPQISGFTFTYDPEAQVREINRDGACELTGSGGSRIQNVTLDDGTVIVEDGEVVDGPRIALATIDFLANGGDCYPLGNFEFSRLGVSYQQALADYIRIDLDGEITADDYPEEGGERITAISATEDEPAEMDSTTSEPESDETETKDAVETETEPEEEDTADAEQQDREESDDTEAEETTHQTYRVVRGDTLQKIATAHLGAAYLWPHIFRLNEGVVQANGRSLTNPDLILIGWILKIPEL